MDDTAMVKALTSLARLRLAGGEAQSAWPLIRTASLIAPKSVVVRKLEVAGACAVERYEDCLIAFEALKKLTPIDEDDPIRELESRALLRVGKVQDARAKFAARKEKRMRRNP